MADTGKWLLDQDSFQDWYWDGRSSSFWLHGLMGSGKSCLSHVVIDKLMSVIDMKNGEQLAYYYIDGNEDRENDDYTTNILRCLLKQLADPGFEGKVMEAVFDAYKNHVEKSHLTEDESVELIRAIVDGNNTTFLVIDGLDECDAPAQESLMYHLSELFTDTKGLLKVFFTSRPGSHIKDLMEPFQPKMIDAVKYNSGDIDKLVKTRVRDSVAMPGLRLLYKRGKEDQSAQVERILRKNAQGMFRWVEMAFSHLHKSKNFGIMQRRLEELPRLQNLFDLYDQVYDSTIQDLDPVDRAALRMTMTLMLYIDKTSSVLLGTEKRIKGFYKRSGQRKRRMFSNQAVQIIAAATYVSPPSGSSPAYEVEEILDLCSSFIVFEKGRYFKRFQFVHFSVREWLLGRREAEFSTRAGHSFLATECLKVFVDDASYERATKVVNSSFVNYASMAWLKHLCTARDITKPQESFFQGEELNALITAFLLESPTQKAYGRWHTHVQGIKEEHYE